MDQAGQGRGASCFRLSCLLGSSVTLESVCVLEDLTIKREVRQRVGLSDKHNETSLFTTTWASQTVLVVKNPPANARDVETRVQSLGWEDPLEEGMATHSSTLAWRIPWTEEPGGLQSMGSQRVEDN